MKNLLKHFLLLSLPLTLALGLASCDKDKDAPGSLAGTTWTCTENVDGHDITVVLNFLTATTGEMKEMVYTMPFTYTYQNGSGTITMQSGDDGQNETYNFTVEGDRLTLNGPEGQKAVFVRTGGDPSDTGEAPESLVGTYWGVSYEGETMGFNFITETTGEMITDGYPTPITYTYQNGSGTITIEIAEQVTMTYTFTVSGNKMTVVIPGGPSMVLTRGEIPEPPAENPMTGTVWSANQDGATLVLAFVTPSSGMLTANGNSLTFTYTYNDGEGDIIFGDSTGHYVVNGDELALTGGGETLVFTRGENPIPPDPGETPESLLGTSWTFQATYGDVTIGQQLIFTTATNVTMRIYDGDDEEMIYTTYTYSNGAGVVYAPEGETGDVPFTVQGNTLVAAFGEMPMTFYRD